MSRKIDLATAVKAAHELAGKPVPEGDELNGLAEELAETNAYKSWGGHRNTPDSFEGDDYISSPAQEMLAGMHGLSMMGDPASDGRKMIGYDMYQDELPMMKGAGASDQIGPPPIRFKRSDLDNVAKSIAGGFRAKAVASAEYPSATTPEFDYTAFPLLRDKVRILRLFPVTTTTRASITAFRALNPADAAATVAEGANKPESNPSWESYEAPVRKIAHWVKMTDEAMADGPGFVDQVAAEMLAGLIDAENEQLLNGDGTGSNLLGLLQNPDRLTLTPAGTDLDAIAEAANLIRTTQFVDPDTVVMHPSDWVSGGFLLAKDSDGNYQMSSPLEDTTPRLWGMRVVTTTRIPENTALVANFKAVGKVHVRQQPTIEIGGGTAEFVSNTHLMRAEERLALTVTRPRAMCQVTVS